jgi:nucleoside 2-deoxyribosyltransferase
MRIYLAGPWARREEVREARKAFLAAGIEVNAQWLDVPDIAQAGQTVETQEHLYDLRAEAQRDLDDIAKSDAMVVMNLEKSEGKAVEQGIAIAQGLPLVVVGRRSNVFQYLERVRVFDTVDDAIAYITGRALAAA